MQAMDSSTTKTAAELLSGTSGRPFSGRFDGFPNSAAAASFKQALIAFGLVDMKQLKQNAELCVPESLAIDPRPSLVSWCGIEGLLANTGAEPPALPTAVATDKRPPCAAPVLDGPLLGPLEELGVLHPHAATTAAAGSWRGRQWFDAAPSHGPSGGGCCGPAGEPPGLHRDVRLHRTLISFGSPSVRHHHPELKLNTLS